VRLLILLLALLLTACGGGEDRSKAQLRLVNASSGYAALDLVVDDQRLQRDVEYGQTASYVEVDPEDSDTKITRPGTSTALASTVPSVNEGDRYTLVAYGGEGSLRTALLDDNTSEPDSGKARVRVLNAAPDAGDVDVYLTGAGAPLADAEALQAGVQAGTVTAYTTVDAATWQLRVTAAGDRKDLRLDLTGIVLASRQIVTLVVTQGEGGVLVKALVVTQRGAIAALAGAHARVRVVAGAIDAGAVIASIGSTMLMNGTGAPAAGAYELVPAGAAEAVVSVAGVPVAVPAATLPAGTDNTLLIWGPATSPAASWITDDNRPPTVGTRVKMRLVHRVAGLDAALALKVDVTPVVEGLAPGGASEPTLVDAKASATLTVTALGRSTPAFSAIEQTLAAGGVYTVFMVGTDGAPAGFLTEDR
jgi:Domain of unknown function (DUF4397)